MKVAGIATSNQLPNKWVNEGSWDSYTEPGCQQPGKSGHIPPKIVKYNQCLQMWKTTKNINKQRNVDNELKKNDEKSWKLRQTKLRHKQSRWKLKTKMQIERKEAGESDRLECTL